MSRNRVTSRISTSVLTWVLALGLAACAGHDANAKDAQADGAPANDASAEVPAKPEVTRKTPTVPEGTSLTFQVTETVSTDTNKQGDYFTTTLTAPAAGLEGGTVLPAGTKGRWIVTQSSDNVDGKAVLAANLESVQVDGTWVPVEATVTDSELKTDNPDSNTETAAKIGIGAAAGAIVGQVLGKNTESTLKGAGVGAALGTAIALSTRGGSAKIEAGSKITVRLDQPLVVR